MPEAREDKWNGRFMRIAAEVASWSKDRSTQVGCVIVTPDRDIVATGYNGLPRGVNDDVEERHQRPTKYKWAEHSERNAIYAAAKRGASVAGCTIYVATTPDILPICCDCARAIIQSGIKEVVMAEPDFSHERWGEEGRVALNMMAEAGVFTHFLYVEDQPDIICQGSYGQFTADLQRNDV